LLTGILGWRAALRRTVVQAIEARHLRADTDPDQVVFEIDGLFVALMREARFLRDAKAAQRAWNSYQRMIGSLLAAAPAPRSRARSKSVHKS